MKRSIEPKITLHTSPSDQHSDGSYPVVIELIHRRRLYRKRTGFRAFPNRWDGERFVCDKRKVRDYIQRNEELNELEEKTREILATMYGSFVFSRFSELMEKESVATLTFLEVCNRYINELYDENRAGNAYYYECVRLSVENYDKSVYLDDINKDWLRNFVKHYTRRGAKSIAYLRGIKAIFGIAIADFGFDYSQMPFKTVYNPIGYVLIKPRK